MAEKFYLCVTGDEPTEGFIVIAKPEDAPKVILDACNELWGGEMVGGGYSVRPDGSIHVDWREQCGEEFTLYCVMQQYIFHTNRKWQKHGAGENYVS